MLRILWDSELMIRRLWEEDGEYWWKIAHSGVKTLFVNHIEERMSAHTQKELTMARRNTTTTTGMDVSKASPTTDSAARAAELSAQVTAALTVIRSESAATDVSRAQHDAKITASWLAVIDALVPLKAGLFAQLKFGSFKDYCNEVFGGVPQYQTVNAYCLAADEPVVRARWDALGMGCAVSVATMLRNKTYSATEKKSVTALADKCSDAYATMTAAPDDIRLVRGLESARAAILAKSKELRKLHRVEKSPADKVQTLKTVDACSKELTRLQSVITEARDEERAVKARLTELKRGAGKATGKVPAVADDRNDAIRRQTAQAVKDGVMTETQAAAFLSGLGIVTRKPRASKGDASK